MTPANIPPMANAPLPATCSLRSSSRARRFERGKYCENDKNGTNSRYLDCENTARRSSSDSANRTFSSVSFELELGEYADNYVAEYSVPAAPPGAAHDTARERAGVLAVAQREDAVDHHVAHAGGELTRRLEGGVVGDRGGVEDDDVGEVAGGEAAAVAQLQVLGRHRGEAADRLGQRHQLLVAHVAAKQPRHVAVGARVGARLEEHALGSTRLGVGAEAHPRQRHLA